MRFRLFQLTVFVFSLFILLSVPSGQLQAAPVASVVIETPDEVRIAEPFTFEVTFDNTHPTDVGYGPFIDLIFSLNGADGAAGTDTPDGIDFIRAEHLGLSIEPRVRTFPAEGCVRHPLLDAETIGGRQVCGTPGDKLVILELPFGSFVPEQPPVTLEITAQVSNLADLGVALPIQARGGFRFGENPVADPCCDPAIVGETVSAPIVPTIISGTKDVDAPEGEIIIGPNFRYTWTIALDIADGQTITDLDVIDYLPNTVVIDASTITTTPAGGTVVTTPPAGVPANPTDNRIVVNFASVTGTASERDVLVTFEFYVPYNDADGNPIIDPVTGDDRIIENNFSGVGDWDSADPRDGDDRDNAIVNGECPTVCPGGSAPTVMSIAGQKSGLTVPAGQPVRAGTIIEYTINFQVSDFFTYGEVVITDILPDGLRFDDTFTPVLSLSGAMTSFTATPLGDGRTQLEFRITDELGTPIIGGCVPPGGTGGTLPDCDAFDGGAALASLTYRAIVQDEFTVDFPSGDPSVDQGDELTNEMTITGDVLDNGDVSTPSGDDESDTSEETNTVERGEPAKSVYAYNGVPCGACLDLRVAAGDTITYRLRHIMPSTDFEDFALVDYLPLPVFSAADVTTFSPALDGAVPPAGTAKLLVPGDTLHTITGTLPALVTDAAQNTVSFIYDDFDTPTNVQSTIDILFTVTMLSEPIADGLQLTNQVQAREGSTNSDSSTIEEAVQVQVTAPFLTMTKGAVSTTNPDGNFIPANASPIPFTPPGSPTPFDGVINSDALAGIPIDSDLANIRPGDIVKFSIVIENLGTGRKGAFDIRVQDIVPEGFEIPPGGSINLQIRLGSGQVVRWEGLGSGGETDLLGPGIELVDPGLDTGVCGPYNGVDGTNIVIITYELQLVAPGDAVLENTAIVTNYSGGGDGGDFTGGDGDLTDRTQVTTSTTIDTGGGDSSTDTGIIVQKRADPPFAQPGEFVTWTIIVSNGNTYSMPDVRVVDNVPQQLVVVDAHGTAGDLFTQGQTYALELDELPSGEEVTFIVETQLAQNLEPPYIIYNSAIVTGGGEEITRTESQVLSAATMPSTGDSAVAWLRPVVLTLWVSGGVLVGLMMLLWWRWTPKPV